MEVRRFQLATGEGEGYYLVVSALVPYKRIDLAVQACRVLGRAPAGGRHGAGAPAPAGPGGALGVPGLARGRQSRRALPAVPGRALPRPTGVFFFEQRVEALVEAIQRFEAAVDRFDPKALRARAEEFDRSHFLARFGAYLEELLCDGPPRPMSG